MKNRNHGLSEKELVQLLMADCESTGDGSGRDNLADYSALQSEH